MPHRRPTSYVASVCTVKDDHYTRASSGLAVLPMLTSSGYRQPRPNGSVDMDDLDDRECHTANRTSVRRDRDNDQITLASSFDEHVSTAEERLEGLNGTSEIYKAS